MITPPPLGLTGGAALALVGCGRTPSSEPPPR